MQNKHLSFTWNTHNKHFIIASQGIFPSGWEAKLTGEVPILGRVIERLGLIIRILSMVNSGFVPDGCIECCGESVQSLQSVKLFE